VQPSSIVAKCKAKGRNTVRVYSDADTYTEEYTNLRAWVMLDLMTDTVYGHREAIERHYIPDLIYLANTTGTTFNGVVQGKSAQQQITDICLGGKWFLPFMHKDANQTLAQWRWLPIEDYDLEADDIPTFTDTGASRNILKDARGLSRIKVSRRDDDKIPNEWTLTFSDAQHKYLERPLLFADSDAQKLAGEVYGDGSLRKVPDTETAFGVTDETTAREVGFYLLDYGRFYTGGIKNNGTVEFVTSHLLWPEALDLHQNKVIKIVSDKLNNLKDPNGDVFTHFIVTAMQTTSRGELVVTCQAFGALRTVEPTVSLCNLHPAPTSPYAGVRFHGSSFNLNRDWAPGGIDPPYPFTVAGRFSIDEDTGDTSGQTICTTGLLGSEWWLGVTPGLKLTFRSNAGDTYGSALTAGQEYHIAVVTKADGARLVYLDGVLDITTTGQAPDDWPAYERGYFLLFGRVGFIGSKILQGGTFRAWKVWDAELTVDEIDEEAGAYYACRTADLWAAWTMENVDRDTWDRSPNCRDLGREGSPVDTTATGLSNLPFYCGGATTGGGGTTGGTTLTSPPDYYLAVDQVRREVVHSWTHVSPITGVNYEIRLDAGGSPGSLVWMGFANQFREAVNVEGSRTYHFRAFTSTVNGNWIVRTINVDYTSGQDDQWILPTQVFDDANVSSGVTGYDRLGIEVFG
jgi:hypothetical protein